ncbi:MAG TPA: hypothetical protein VMK66_00485 [Myxococcales bacterium]|nr:hypothetical protein [Myxococcales bacterium]
MRALAFLLLAAACTPDFDSVSDVKDLRVLAIQADPPEALFDADAGTADALAVRVLAVDPRQDGGVQSAHLDVCGPTDSGRCDQGPIFDAGTVPLAFTFPPFDPRQVLGNDELGAYNGIRVQLSFTVDGGLPGDPVHAAKTVIYSPVDAPWLTAPDCSRNHNPSLTDVRLTIEGADAGLLADAGLQVGTEYGMRPVLAPGAQEAYCALDLRGNLVRLTEQAHYSFFTGPGGEFDNDTADEPLDGGAPPDGLARFTPHADAGTIWIVVRDGRGGESWMESRWTAQ